VRFKAGEPLGVVDGLSFTPGAAVDAGLAGERLVGVAATTIGGTVLVLDVFALAGPSTIRMGSSIDPDALG
jgi:hypothetical protein